MMSSSDCDDSIQIHHRGSSSLTIDVDRVGNAEPQFVALEK